MPERLDVGRLLAAALLLLGFLTSSAGLVVLHEWSAVGWALASLGLAWTFMGVSMLVSAAWLILSLRRQQFPLALGGGAAIISGVLIMAGFLTHVVPCTGRA